MATNLVVCPCLSCGGKLVCHRTYRRHLHSFTQKNREIQLQKPSLICDQDVSDHSSKNNYLNTPLFDGSSTTLLQEISKHLMRFSSDNGMAKKSVSLSLKHTKELLPCPNVMPASFKEAVKLIQHQLIELQRFDCCVNDCLIFRNQYKENTQCAVCSEPRFYNNGVSEKCARKIFLYMPLGPRLQRWFECENLCKLLYGNAIEQNGVVGGIEGSEQFKQWYEEGGVFEECCKQESVPLALFCDGLNTSKNKASQKSMWPLLLTWLTLPVKLRTLLGPLMIVGIVPGNGHEEPKSLDPYVDILVDELLTISEFKCVNSYTNAPVTVKVALLQYLCDVPAFGKLLHVSGQAAIRACPYCDVKGQYCKQLHKVIHATSRQFISQDHPLRDNVTEFASKTRESAQPPTQIDHEEETFLREQYEHLPNKNQRTKMQKETGLKGVYPFMRLPYHNRSEQMQPDGMHTIVDVISNIFNVLTGKLQSEKLEECEKVYQRFVVEEEVDTIGEPSQKRQKVERNWELTKDAIKTADQRATSIQYPKGCVDFKPDNHFSKQWTLRTMNGQLKFVTSGAAQWCLRGLLPHTQERTLFRLFSLFKKFVAEEFKGEEITELENETHVVLALLEKDFPLALQTITTHLIHHIPDGIRKLGPLYGRWLFPYERVNSWLSRQGLNKKSEESTIMQTYVIYDWCVYQALSGTIDCPEFKRIPTSHLAEKNPPIVKEVPPNSKPKKNVQKLHRKKGMWKEEVFRKGTFVYYLRNSEENKETTASEVMFGKVTEMFQIPFGEEIREVVAVQIYQSVAYVDKFWTSSMNEKEIKLLNFKDISHPLSVGVEANKYWYINSGLKIRL